MARTGTRATAEATKRLPAKYARVPGKIELKMAEAVKAHRSSTTAKTPKSLPVVGLLVLLLGVVLPPYSNAPDYW